MTRACESGHDIYHGPPKPTCLEVFVVNNLVFRRPKPLFFMVLGAHGIYIYINIQYIYIYTYIYIYIFIYGYRKTYEIYYDMVMLCGHFIRLFYWCDSYETGQVKGGQLVALVFSEFSPGGKQ